METEAFVRNLIRAWNAHDLDLIQSFYGSKCVGIDVSQPKTHHGRAGIRQMAGGYFTAFPDLSLTLEQTVCNGENVVAVWTARGVHRGSFMQIPPTGKPICVRGVSLMLLQSGCVQHITNIWDVAGLLRNIGLLPEL
jgi:steroid delta-isomerase-like uncharacterized protein